MIFIAFENNVFPLLKQYPSGVHDWNKDDMDSSQFLRKESDTLLPSFQRKEKIKNEKPKDLVNDLN